MSVPEIAASIIIPVFNKVDFTERCLAALQRHETATSFEIILVDNASTDSTPQILADLVQAHAVLTSDAAVQDRAEAWFGSRLPHRIQVITNDQNKGFVEACNQGAAAAAGEFLVFLNNDTEPRPGWLDALVKVARSDQSAGAVGAKLIYPNGQLQEAGGIIFSDGNGWNFGRQDQPDLPEYSYVREVDYCSGAALMVRTALFRQIGGFDMRYSPAYYEDTDMCFSVRKAGYKVMYQPEAEVIHHEGVTAGTDLEKGFKRYQVRNRELFLEKWADVLSTEHGAPADENGVRKLSHRHSGKRILWFDPLFPMYDRASGSKRLWEILNILAGAGNHVSFMAVHQSPEPDNERYIHELQQAGVEVQSYSPEVLAPLFAKGWGMEHVGARIASKGSYDLIVISFHYVAKGLIPLLRKAAPDVPIVVDSVDVHFLREQRQADLLDDPAFKRSAEATKKQELETYAAADAVITVTDEDADALRKHNPDLDIWVVPNIHEIIEDSPGYAERDDLLFVGSFNHPPNGDAVRWLHESIWPVLKERLPGVRISIVGPNPPDDITSFSSEDFSVHGYVKDLDDMLARTKVSLAPLRYGAGMKGKVGEALACGLPVVGTPVAFEGMGLSHEKEVLIADEPTDFADQIARLFSDEDLWNRLRQSGKENIRRRYSRQAVLGRLDQMLERFTGNDGGTKGLSAGPALQQGPGPEYEGVSRNQPCPCGSGKKFKVCHGAMASTAVRT